MTSDIARQLGVELTAVIPHSFDDGIEAVRSIWPLLQINKPNCSILLDAVKGYRKKKNEALSTDDQPAYYKNPVESWENHLMDALRHLAITYRYMSIDGEHIGATVPVAAEGGYSDEKSWDYDPLGRNKR